MIKRILIYTALSILLLSCQEANVGKSNQFSKDVLHFLKNSEKFELLSLDPYKNKDLKNDFHGYPARRRRTRASVRRASRTSAELRCKPLTR